MNNPTSPRWSLRKLLLTALVAGPLASLPAPLWALGDDANKQGKVIENDIVIAAAHQESASTAIDLAMVTVPACDATCVAVTAKQEVVHGTRFAVNTASTDQVKGGGALCAQELAVTVSIQGTFQKDITGTTATAYNAISLGNVGITKDQSAVNSANIGTVAKLAPMDNHDPGAATVTQLANTAKHKIGLGYREVAQPTTVS